MVKLNGLPFRASEREVEDWLAEAADPVEVIIEMDRLVGHSTIKHDRTDFNG